MTQTSADSVQPSSAPAPGFPSGRTTVSSLTRRRFLTFTGVGAAGALGFGGTQVRWNDLIAAAAQTPLDPTTGVLVVVTLYGGNDGLNTVVPASDPTYQSSRADLAYQPDEVLDLGDGLGLNPGMNGLHALWGAHQLAILPGVGYPRPDRSHFRSMAIWQTASPQTAVTTGWLGRWLDATTTNPLLAVSVDSLVPPMLAGSRLAAASFPLAGLRLPPDPLGQAVARLADPYARDGSWQARAAKSYADLQAAAAILGPAKNPAQSKPTRAKSKHTKSNQATPSSPDTPGTPDSEDDQGGRGGSAGGAGQLAAQLELVATLVEMGVPTRVYSVSLGGFDTHSDERGTQQRLLTELDTALSNFQARLQKTPSGQQVVTMVYSEFGRRVVANASEGTDHGTAGPVFVFGRGVHGGLHGTQPSLTDLDEGDLKASTDFRSIYATLLGKVLGTDPGRVLDGYHSSVESLIT